MGFVSRSLWVSGEEETHGGVDAEQHAVDADRSGGGVSTGEVASLECVGDRTLGVGVDSAVRPRWRTHLAFAMAIRV